MPFRSVSEIQLVLIDIEIEILLTVQVSLLWYVALDHISVGFRYIIETIDGFPDGMVPSQAKFL